MQQIDAKAHNRHSSRYLHRQFGMPSFSFTLSFLVCMFGSWSNIGVDATAVTNLRPPQPEDPPRDLSSSSSSSYHTLGSTKLGVPNPDAAIGNPLKGLVESPVYTNPPYKADIPLAVEFYYFGLDEVMKGNPDVVGEKAAFDWSVLDNALSGSASRHMHAVWRVIMDFPGKPLQVPRYLLDAGIEMRGYDGGTSPYYGDSQLLEAVEQFVTRMGKRYDGDKRLAFVQAGIVGFWGEWHTGGVDAIPDGVTDQLVGWYASSFTKTKIQLRYSLPSGYKAGFGRHDDSFAFETLDGEANGGVVRDYYFWPDVVKQKQNDFWKRGVMGGETRGHLQQEIFEPWYSARTFEKQDFMDCVTTTHTTYIFHHSAFREGGFTGTELTNARHAHARMGYNFYVSEVAAKASSATQQVNIDVTVKQIGVAPFYYDLSLGLRCPGMTKKTVAGVNSLIDNGSTKVFSFSGIPATTACLDSVSLSLESSYAYQKRPIKFAQGNGTVAFSLPLPGGAPTAPVASPLRQSNANPSPATATVTTDQGGSNPLFGRIFYTFTAFLQHIASSF